MIHEDDPNDDDKDDDDDDDDDDDSLCGRHDCRTRALVPEAQNPLYK
jgi:hypothetical protein